MQVHTLADPDATARAAARFIVSRAERAIAERGRFCAAISGGSTPWLMLSALPELDPAWTHWHLFQVDERVAPAGSEHRNLTHMQASLGAQAAARISPMPVEHVRLAEAADEYAGRLRAASGTPPVLDLVHLGLGADGHTASLVPGDAVLGIADADVAMAGPYQGTLRMTLTYRMIERARAVLWLVTGNAKTDMLRRLIAHDAAIPAGRVESAHATLYADRAAMNP